MSPCNLGIITDTDRTHRRVGCAAMLTILALGGLSPARKVWSAAEGAARIDTDGTLRVPALSLAPSDFWSPQFKSAYMKHMAQTLKAPENFGLPAMSASASEWAQFNASFDRSLAEPIAWDLTHFRVRSVESRIAGVNVAILTPLDGVARSNEHRVLINLHGFSHGLSEGKVESIPIASSGRITVITIDYRLEPDYKYPASSEDVAAVYQELLKQYKPGAIGIFGSSGGGVLTAQVLAWLQSKGLPTPGAAGIFWSGLATAPFPWGKSGDSVMWGFRAFPQSDHSEVDQLHADLASSYLGGVRSDDTTAYPGSSDAVLTHFPPVLFLSGTRAIDLSPAVRGHARLLKLGVDASLYVMEGGWHGASLGQTEDSPEEHDANAYIARWFGRHLAR
jgi:monoterpene epsilon-lactone hydrolase